ncbi:MAG: inositol monophosphatase family protein [Alphaproteobacteria bacterium]|nr:MAG: inositol monophosphatase family protein [Alphaproteobacteria bacterium]TAF13672.1 MAG: inositol monophosphatase family protein [Alphaproteobacteria bacterium]TAF39581.1 MAG: inositol monophosphatase family protein [Alphaproteobacteria bacterium]TAF75373.1 MAG: inositol monophosphatase family protein [Alphaproteobacteria bacterium]
MSLLSSYFSFAHQLADQACEIAQSFFRNAAHDAELKADSSPVTLADKLIEHALRERIMHQYHYHGIIGEEAHAHQADADYQWIIDPIDGTRAFASGIPTFSTLIGLMHRKEMLLGVVVQPFTQERWWGDNNTARTHNKPLCGAATRMLHHAKLATTSPFLFKDEEYAVFDFLRRHTAIQNYGGDAYNYMMLASGHIDVVLEAGLKPYDILPLLPILRGARAMISDWHGRPLCVSELIHNDSINVLATANKALHERTLDSIQALL